MTHTLTIGDASRLTGLPITSIRYYERRGLLLAPARTNAGYRLYGPTDVRRLRLIRRARLLGMALADVKPLVDRAFASECVEFAGHLIECIARQRTEIAGRIRELEELSAELHGLERHVRHEAATATPGQRVADCSFCPIIDEQAAAGDHGFSVSM